MFADASCPLVSVVVPCYRHECFVAAALASVHAQTYPNIELVVIDDASPDGTFASAGEWASIADAEARFSGFHLSRNATNLGAHGSINRGCAESSGEYIAILNSDDLFHPRRLEEMMLALTRQEACMGFTRVVPIDTEGRPLSPVKLPITLAEAFSAADRALANAPTLTAALSSQNIAISTGNLLFRRDLLESLGLFANLAYVHDWDFVRRASLHGPIAYLPRDLYFYRVHATNSFAQLSQVAALETEIVHARYAEARRVSKRASK